VEAAEKGTNPTPELRISWLSEKYGALPRAGGILDQDWQLLNKMNVHSNIYNTVARLRGMKGTEIHKLTDAERRLIKYLRDERLL